MSSRGDMLWVHSLLVRFLKCFQTATTTIHAPGVPRLLMTQQLEGSGLLSKGMARSRPYQRAMPAITVSPPGLTLKWHRTNLAMG